MVWYVFMDIWSLAYSIKEEGPAYVALSQPEYN
jgi:hypothetical protein